MSPRFQELEELDRDERSVTYRAMDEVLACEVTLERIERGVAQDRQLESLLRRTARALAQVRSPHVVQVLDTGEDERGFYLVTEKTDGEILSQRLEARGHLDLEEALVLIGDVCRGLAAAHKAHLVHGSVSSDEVIVQPDGRASLGGFQLATKIDGAPSMQTSIGQRSSCWKRGDVREQVAPEMRIEGRPTPQSDVFATACLLVECLCGRRPFPALGGELVDVGLLRRLRPDLPSWLDPVLERALAIVPADRYVSVMDFAEALERREEPRAAVAPPPRRRLSPSLGGALALVGVTALGVTGYRVLADRGVSLAQPEFVSSETGLLNSFSDSHALVIGIDEYSRVDRLPDLECAKNDGSSLVEYLLESGYSRDNVKALYNDEATRKTITDELERLTDVGPNDRVLVYFAGHGEQRTSATTDDQYGRIVPYDADIAGDITIARLIQDAKASRAKHYALILDCCYSGNETVSRFRSGAVRLDDARTNACRFILASGSPGKRVGDEYRDGHSPFTYFLLQTLRSGGEIDARPIVGTDLWYGIRSAMAEAELNQSPRHRLEGNGDFVFDRVP